MKWIPFLATFMILEIFIIFFLIEIPNERGIEKVNCYDKEGNKIIGLECEEVIVGLSDTFKWITGILMTLISFIVGFMLFREEE